jgi:hypothetical protein
MLKKKFLRCFNKTSTMILDKIPIFYPETPAMILWDFIVTISILYFMIFLPLDLASD